MTNDSLRHIMIAEPADADAPAWRLFAVGDICVAPGNVILDLAASGVEAAPCVERELAQLMFEASIAVGNLEGAISGVGAIPKAGPSVQIDPALPIWARAVGFNMLALANNHIMDWGAPGLSAVLEACRSENLAVCGAGRDAVDAMRPVEQAVAGNVRVAVFAFCEREFGIAGPGTSGAAWIGHPEALGWVRAAASTNDVVVVIAHGGVEEVPLPPPERQDQLRALIDAGATLVIGHHPHVPQGWECYGRGAIFYSLGNFLFDYPEGLRYPKTEWGLALDVEFRGRTLHRVGVIPIEMIPGRGVERVEDVERAGAMLRHLHGVSAILADRDAFEGHWQAIALHLWRTRYRRWLQRASGVQAGGNMRTHLKGLAGALRRRMGMASGATNGLPGLGNPLMLLNLLRNESHRWAIERALAVESGDEPDRMTPEIVRHVEEMLKWTEGA